MASASKLQYVLNLSRPTRSKKLLAIFSNSSNCSIVMSEQWMNLCKKQSIKKSFVYVAILAQYFVVVYVAVFKRIPVFQFCSANLLSSQPLYIVEVQQQFAFCSVLRFAVHTVRCPVSATIIHSAIPMHFKTPLWSGHQESNLD